MKLSEYIRNNSCEKYNYIGSIWGDFSGEITKDDLLFLLEKDLPEFDGEILENHPAYGLPYSENEYGEMEKISGYYPENSGKIIYASKYTQEVVLVEYDKEDQEEEDF